CRPRTRRLHDQRILRRASHFAQPVLRAEEARPGAGGDPRTRQDHHHTRKRRRLEAQADRRQQAATNSCAGECCLELATRHPKPAAESRVSASPEPGQKEVKMTNATDANVPESKLAVDARPVVVSKGEIPAGPEANTFIRELLDFTYGLGRR